MQPTFPQIKVMSKDVDIKRAKCLKHDLRSLSEGIMLYTPSDFNSGKLDRTRIRIFKFSRREGCNEFFTTKGNVKYVCLNASLFKRRYYAGLFYTLHGIAHSFCHFKDEIAEEAFCEFVAHSVIKDLINNRGKKFSRRTTSNIMKKSPKEYNAFYRAARKLEKRENGIMLKLNAKAKNKKISKKKEKTIFYRLTKMKNFDDGIQSSKTPELERGFRKI